MPMPKDIDAVRYWRVAFKRLDEAELLLTKLSLPAAAVYMGGYAVECILKALIIERTPRGQRAEALRNLKDDFGHNLRRLRVGVLERGAHPPDMSPENYCWSALGRRRCVMILNPETPRRPHGS